MAMALVKKAIVQTTSNLTEGRTSAVATREAEAQCKRARTLAKQQQAAEHIAAATGQLASGIGQASSAAEELKRASDPITTGAEETSSAAQESPEAFQQVGGALARQLLNADIGSTKGLATLSKSALFSVYINQHEAFNPGTTSTFSRCRSRAVFFSHLSQ
jgi:methyl-accepting chemotaxis protein